MAHNVILRKVTVTDQWQAMSSIPLVASVTLSTPPTNTGPVLFRTVGEPAHEVPWVPGEWHELRRIDLATVEVKGAAGDVVTVIGGTW